DKLMPLKFIHALQAMTNDECSVSERAFRDHARDPFLLARQGTALQVSGVGTQQPEHVRIIVHGSRPEMLGSRGLGLHLSIWELHWGNSSNKGRGLLHLALIHAHECRLR